MRIVRRPTSVYAGVGQFELRLCYMKPRLFFVSMLVVLLAGSGCARHYLMKMSNGIQITTATKPKLKGQTYYYKDAAGKTIKVPQSRVLEIMPASMAKEQRGPFKPSLQ
jgi:hypothetical protein